MTRSGSTLRALAQDRRGIALIEFALSLPVLLLMLLGCFTYTNGMNCSRKLTITTRAIADLTARQNTVTQASLDDILAVDQPLMAPFGNANAHGRVSQITVDSSGRATVSWSRGRNRTPLVVGSTYPLASSISYANSNYIVAEMSYDYVAVPGPGSLGSRTFSQSILMIPRKSSSITCSDCT